MVVAYGPPEPLGKALDALDGRYPVTVVDNGSDPATAALASAHGARYLDSGANLGFAAGVNVALRTLPLASVDVLLLNPDARIDPESLSRLHEAMRSDPTVGAVAPALQPPGSAGRSTSQWPWHTPLRPWVEAVGLGRRRARHTFLSGAVLLLRGATLLDVGLLDERFFLYAEEEDWQRRARRRGWRLEHRPDVVAVHTSGGTDADAERSQLRLHAAAERYVRKWYGPAGWSFYRAGTILGYAVRAVVRRGTRRRRSWRLVRWYLTGPDRAARRAGVLPAPPEGA